MVLAPDVQSARVVVTDTESGEVTTYMFDTREVELYALPESKFEVVVEVDGEVEAFVVE